MERLDDFVFPLSNFTREISSQSKEIELSSELFAHSEERN